MVSIGGQIEDGNAANFHLLRFGKEIFPPLLRKAAGSAPKRTSTRILIFDYEGRS